MADVDLQHLVALDVLTAGLTGQHLFHLDGQGAFGRQADGVVLQAGGDLHFLDLAVQSGLHGVEQGFVLGGGLLGGLLLLVGLQAQVAAVDVLELDGAVLALGILAGEAVHDLEAELVHVLGQQQQVIALVQHQRGGGQLGQTVGGVAGGEVDVLLVGGHLLDVLLQRDHLLLLGGVEQQQAPQQLGVHPVVGIDAELDLAAELLPEVLVLLPVIDQHGVQLVLDLLFQGVVDQLELAVLLQGLAADVQAQVLAVHDALDEAEIVGQQVGALVHDEHARSIEGQALLILLGVKIVGAVRGDKEQGVVVGGALGAADDDPGGVGVIAEVVLVELVVLLVGDFALLLLPDGHHAVQSFQLGVFLPLGLVVLGLGVGLGLLTALGALHLDGVADVVAVLLDDGGHAVLRDVVVVVLGVGVGLDVQDDVGAGGLLPGGGDLIALHAAGLPLPGLAAAVSLGNDGDAVGHHKGGVEAHAELADDVDVLIGVLGLEVLAARMGDGAQVLLQFFPGHADAVVRDGEHTVFLVKGEQDAEILPVHPHRGVGQALEVELVDGVGCVGDQLPQEDLLVGVDRVDHQVHQLFAFGLERLHCHSKNLFSYRGARCCA